MVFLLLQLKADLENLTNLQQEDPSTFVYYFKVRFSNFLQKVFSVIASLQEEGPKRLPQPTCSQLELLDPSHPLQLITVTEDQIIRKVKASDAGFLYVAATQTTCHHGLLPRVCQNWSSLC